TSCITAKCLFSSCRSRLRPRRPEAVRSHAHLIRVEDARSMWARLYAALAGTAGSAAVLATVRSGWLDVVDGVGLVASLAVLARTAIRLASDPSRTRRRQR